MDEPSTSGCKKRKRPSKDSPSDTDNDAEYEVYTKYFNTDPRRKKYYFKTYYAKTEESPKESEYCRKRKFCYPTEELGPRKIGKFTYLTDFMTKQRKRKTEEIENVKSLPKITASAENDEIGEEITDKLTKETVLRHSKYNNCDLFHTEEICCNYEASKKQDLSFYIFDEIALEGLDGITVEAFWKRIRTVFPVHINKTMAERIWKIICNNKHIDLHILENPREELMFNIRSNYLDIEKGEYVEPFIEFRDIYPLVPINDGDVRGSCSTYNSRKRNNMAKKYSLEKAVSTYGQKLVIVADQVLRNKALFSNESDPNVDCIDIEYCMLERIGRSRFQGEISQGNMSLRCMEGNNHKNIHHNRKNMEKNYLIASQPFFLKSITAQQNKSCTLINLPRFYHKRKTKQIMIMEKVSRLLKERPNCQMEMSEFWSILGRQMPVLKITKTPEFRKFFSVSLVPYRRVHPNAQKSEYLIKAKKKERMIRVVRLLDPTVNVLAIYESKESASSLVKTDQSDPPGRFFHNTDIVRNVYKYIASYGKEGAITHDTMGSVQLDFYAIRLALRKLLGRDLLSSKKIDSFRQQSGKFYPKHFDDPDIQLNTTLPKKHELSGRTLSKLRAQYESNLQPDSIMYSGSGVEPVVIIENKQIANPTSTCAIFQTDISPGDSEDINICDIIAMGRDRLLLAHSNLLMFFESEDLSKYILKRLNFVKTTPFFMYGFGKVVCDFLNTVNLSKAFTTDNLIVFSEDNLTAYSEIKCNPVNMSIQAAYFTDAYDGEHEYDMVSKVYVFEALFDENHVGQKAGQKLKNIFERLQVLKGLKKVDQGRENARKINLEVTSQVIMEKFMGPKPEVVFVQDEEDGVKMEIFVSTPPSEFVEPGTEFKSLVAEKTRRFEDRANIILKSVYENKVVRDTIDFVNTIRMKEKEEGFDRLICRKSVKRILTTLVKDGHVKVIKIVLTGKLLIKARTLVCVPNVDFNHSLVQSTIEELRLKFYTAHRASVGHSKTTVNVKTNSQSPFSSADVKNSISELKQLVSADCRVPSTLDRSVARFRYGYGPKFVRMRILHEFLFYVMRDMRTPAPLPLEEVLELCDSFKIKVRKEDVTSLPPVYRKEISWKMFIPPLPKHKEWPAGWALACDITLRLPLSVYLKLYNTRFEIPEIEPYIRHPIKRHFLLKYLPPNIRNLLLYKRKYMFSIHEIFCNLCYIGLLQLGPRHYKEKDQIFIYLNENASILNTCNSAEGYNKIEKKQYKKLTFKFRFARDVEQYWTEMCRICMNTPLGRRKVMEGKYVVIEKTETKPSMIETLKPATPHVAPGRDIGRIPGDRLGAAGLDSSLWSYVKRNWLWSVHLDKRNVDLQSHVTGLRKEQMKNVYPKPIEFEHLSKFNPADNNKVYLKRCVQPATHKVTKLPKTRRVISHMKSKRKVVRKVLPYPTKEKRMYHDALDERIMGKNKLSRVGWDDDEDSLLRLFRAGAVFLCPQIKNQTIPYNIMRDLLHRVCPKSKNKTSRCIQRRLHQLVINDNIMRIMEVNVENLLNSEVISKYFEQLHDRYRNGEKASNSNINVAYVYLLSYMIEHRREVELLLLGYIATVDFFSEPYIELFSLLLDNLEMESAQGNYSAPRSVDDITRDSIKSLIHCSLSCKNDSFKKRWSYHLFQIYRNFSDETIRSVVIELRKKHFLTISKMTEGKESNWHIPIKFSHLYSTMKSCTYTAELFFKTYQSFKSIMEESKGASEEHLPYEFLSFNEINTFWQKLRLVFDIPEMGIILNPAFEDHSEVIDELSKRLHLYLQRIHESQKVDREDVVESVAQIGEDFERVKACVTRIIFRVPYLMEGTLDIYYKKLMDSSSSLEINNYIFLITIDLKNFARSNILSKPELKKFIDGIEDYAEEWRSAVKNLSKVVFIIQQYNKNKDIGDGSLETMFEKWESEELNFDNETTSNTGINTRLVGAQFAIKNISNGMDYCLKKAVEGEFPSVDEIKEGMMADFEESEKRKIPHITDVTMLLTKERFPDLDADEETVRLWKEHFVYQYPKLDTILIEDPDEFSKNSLSTTLLNEDARNATFAEVQKPVVAKKPNLLDVLNYISSEGGGTDEVQFVENVIKFVEKKMHFGATSKELKDNFLGQSTLDLHRLLQALCSINVFLRAGVLEIAFVHYKFQSEWMVDTFSFTDEEKELFQSKDKNDAKKLRNDIAERLKVTEPLKVLLRPWTALDGSLNKQVFIDWLCVVLSHCLDHPNLSFLNLCRHFSHLKPVDVFYLVEVLQSIGSIEINLCEPTSSRLVSSRKKRNATKATFLDSFEEIVVTSLGVAGLSIGACIEKEYIGQELTDFILD